MNFAFAIFKYFPFGGLQRDMLRMAECAVGRGHRVTVFTASWKGEEPPDGIQVRILKVRGWSNHGRARSFERLFRMESAPFDAIMCIIGFAVYQGVISMLPAAARVPFYGPAVFLLMVWSHWPF